MLKDDKILFIFSLQNFEILRFAVSNFIVDELVSTPKINGLLFFHYIMVTLSLEKVNPLNAM